MTLGMVSCDKNSANAEDPYVEISANDQDATTGGSGGSGGN